MRTRMADGILFRIPTWGELKQLRDMDPEQAISVVVGMVQEIDGEPMQMGSADDLPADLVVRISQAFGQLMEELFGQIPKS